MKKTLGTLAAVFAFSLLLRWPSVAIPLERDEGGYAYIAQRWARGEVPYQSAFDQKFPGVYAAYRFLGSTPESIHWRSGFYHLGTLALVFFLGRRLISLEAGAIAAALCALMAVDPSLAGNAANTEIFMILPLAGAVLAAQSEGVPWGLAAGALAASAVLFKQTAAFEFLLVLYLLKKTPRRLAALAGAAAVVLPVFAYFAATGAWREFYDCTIGYNLSYADRAPLSAYPVRFWLTFSETLKPFWPVYAFAAWGAWKRGGLLPRWLAAAALSVAAGGRFRNHYFIEAVPPLALLAAGGIADLRRRRIPAAAAVLAVGLLASPWYYLPGPAEAKSRRIYGYNPFPESADAARYIAENSGPEDTVFVFGSEPQIYFYSARKSATRYIYVYPLFTPFPGTRERQRAAMDEVRAAKPRFIVTVSAATSFLVSPGSPLDLYADMKELLSSKYRVAREFRPAPEGPKSLTVWERVRKSS